MEPELVNEQLPQSWNLADEQLTRASMFAGLNVPHSEQRELAWREFRARYAPVIAGFARRCGASDQDIDDIIQDVITWFLAASGEFAYDPSRGRFRGWLKTCTVRTAIRRAGKNLRFRNLPLEDVPQIELAADADWNELWEKQLVSRALVILRKECRESVTFRAFEKYVLLDVKPEIVAHELQTSVNSVHQAKTRLTKRLREIVQQLTEFES